MAEPATPHAWEEQVGRCVCCWTWCPQCRRCKCQAKTEKVLTACDQRAASQHPEPAGG